MSSPARHDNIEHRVCVQTVLVYSVKVAMFNDPFWFRLLFGTVFGSTWIINFLDVDWLQSSSRLFVGSSAMIASVFSSSASSAISSSAVSTGDSAAGSGALAASMDAGSSVLAVFLTRVHIVKLSRNSCVMRVASVDLWLRYHAGLHPPVGFDVWARDVSVVRASHSLQTELLTGVLWVSTGNHLCDAPIQAR